MWMTAIIGPFYDSVNMWWYVYFAEIFYPSTNISCRSLFLSIIRTHVLATWYEFWRTIKARHSCVISVWYQYELLFFLSGMLGLSLLSKHNYLLTKLYGYLLNSHAIGSWKLRHLKQTFNVFSAFKYKLLFTKYNKTIRLTWSSCEQAHAILISVTPPVTRT